MVPDAPDNEFADLRPPAAEDVPAAEPLALLGSLAGTVDEWLGAAGNVQLESGFDGNLGVQYRFIASIPKYGFRDSLFEAYVPPTGYPVRLNFFDPQSRFEPIPDAARLRQRLREWVNSDPIRKRVGQLVELAQRAAQ